MDINEIREITKINAEKRDAKNRKEAERRSIREAKYAEKYIAKSNRLILKAAKKGFHCLSIHPKKSLTDSQCWIIKRYFEDAGYGFSVDLWTNTKRLIRIRW